MKYLISILLLITFSSNVIFSQKNNAKLHITPFVFTEARVGFERVITEKSTIQANVGTLIPQKVPNFLYDEASVSDYGGEVELLNKLSGFTMGLEYRLYPGSKKETPRGFYLGPYLKYNHYAITTSSAFEYTLTQDEYANDLTPNQQVEAYPNTDGTFTIDATSKFKGAFNQMGGGIEIGYQWLIGDRISIDWTFFGIGVESDAFVVDISSEAIPVDYTQWGNFIEDEVKDFMSNDLPVDMSDKVKVKVENDKVRTTVKPLILPAFKLSMISIGFAF